MSVFASILVPLDGSVTASRSVGCAAWLAERLGARLHLVSATFRHVPPREELQRLQVAERYWSLVELHQAPTNAEAAILAAVARYRVGLVVMSASGEAGEAAASSEVDPTKIVGHVTRIVIEQSVVPTLLIPSNYEEVLPWERMLVPVSGEVASDDALALAVRLASALDLCVDVVHVADPDPRDDPLAPRLRYADALHHEYSARLEEIVTRALSSVPPEEARRVREFALRRGATVGALLETVEGRCATVIAVGWHGRFVVGRARILKGLLPAVRCPVLLVKARAPRASRLNVGEEFG